ncbi:MAG TPA: WecB/TagA/CpsF family glycosyltransferase [Terracidiphilus sp.]|jgi:N-acetylglucosaminyldiphosphoundecaprenol N-acetyl-beta-D-mannosaminyltransferase|nr:WecB/TagA/CpsF family glycosyltransferase [Terracidiphilus sp.]
MKNPEFAHFRVLGVPIAATNMNAAIRKVRSWIECGDRGRTVTFSNVHMVVEGIKNPRFFEVLQKSDMNCPDGKPLVWYGRSKAGRAVEQVCGPDFLPAFCEATTDLKLRHFFYGGADGVAAKAAGMLQQRFPGTEIAGFYSPPFRALAAEEKQEVVRTINESRADVVWVCLGCPKQETWIDEFKDKLDVPVLLAVGLALDIVAGTRERAPSVMRRLGLEWFYRLCQEPRRLWRRYLIYNGIFVYHLVAERLQPAARAGTKA